jgi:rRNA maturation endonuclease Nob1
MGLFDRIIKSISGSDSEEKEYRCINCGGSFERNYRECPECGQPYVASTDPETQE